ncbi:hypothetical protein FRB96_004656 [Tulasnella sp. 330]|nr:hypothetical protein FRB96_004656 [Tulasnella sp. 330]
MSRTLNAQVDKPRQAAQQTQKDQKEIIPAGKQLILACTPHWTASSPGLRITAALWAEVLQRNAIKEIIQTVPTILEAEETFDTISMIENCFSGCIMYAVKPPPRLSFHRPRLGSLEATKRDVSADNSGRLGPISPSGGKLATSRGNKPMRLPTHYDMVCAQYE